MVDRRPPSVAVETWHGGFEIARQERVGSMQALEETPMTTLITADFDATDLMDEPVDAWSLDELDRDADLESLRWVLKSVADDA
jgi:hypothetical protein